MRRGFGAIAFATLAIALTTPCLAQFTAPIQISSSGSGCTVPRLARDGADNIVFVYVCNGDVFFTTTAVPFGTDANITDNPANTLEVDLIENSGTVRLVFDEFGATGAYNILTTSNSGGSFGSPLNLTASDTNDTHPRIARTPLGQFGVTWTRTTATFEEQVFYRHGLLGSNDIIANGVSPELAMSYLDVTHLVFERDGDLFYITYEAGAYSPEVELATTGNASIHAVEVDTDIHVLYSDDNGLQYATNESGSFVAEVIAPNVDSAKLALSSGGLAVVYEAAGEVSVISNSGSGWSAAMPIGTSAASNPDIVFDSLGYVHVAYAEGGAIEYVNNVPLPTVDFAADVTSGELLLGVTFDNLTTGVVESYHWDFGDGDMSNEFAPFHIYEETGTYTVTLTATGPGGVATETKTDYITATDPTNVLSIPWIDGFASQHILHPVVATNTVSMQGFGLAITFNNAITPIESVVFDGTATGLLQPEFVVTEIDPAGAASTLVVAVVFDIQEPFDGRTIDPGANNLLALLDYTVPIGLSVGTTSPIELTNGVGESDFNNVFTTDEGLSLLPYLESGGIDLSTPPVPTFLRADATHTGIIDIADAIFLLSYLFAGGATPPCFDAADANDTGMVDIADAIYILDYLFAGGSAPPYPFPIAGLDPTPDSFPDCD